MTPNIGPLLRYKSTTQSKASNVRLRTAPDEAHRALTMRGADSLRGLAFAVEADYLMRSGGQTPTGEQLASADSARRNRAAELNRALEDLKVAIAPKK